MFRSYLINLFNLVINLITVIDHFITKLKRSKWFFGEIEMNDVKNDSKNNDYNISIIIRTCFNQWIHAFLIIIW